MLLIYNLSFKFKFLQMLNSCVIQNRPNYQLNVNAACVV